MVAIKLDLELASLLLTKIKQDAITMYCGEHEFHYVLVREARRSLVMKFFQTTIKNLSQARQQIITLRLNNSEAAIFNEAMKHIDLQKEPYYAQLYTTWLVKYDKHMNTYGK